MHELDEAIVKLVVRLRRETADPKSMKTTAMIAACT
jgi:hypothetical protein